MQIGFKLFWIVVGVMAFLAGLTTLILAMVDVVEAYHEYKRGDTE